MNTRRNLVFGSPDSSPIRASRSGRTQNGKTKAARRRHPTAARAAARIASYTGYLMVMILIPIIASAQSSIDNRQSSISWTEFQDPPVEYRPWIRWWWPGNDVTEEELRREIDLLADNYFGGVEVQAFTMGLDPDAPAEEMARRLSYDSPSYYRNLAAVMDQAKKRGLQVDVNLGTGWPSGGPHLTSDQNLQTLLWNEHRVRGPLSIMVKVPKPDKPIMYYLTGIIGAVLHTDVMSWHGDEAKIVAVIAGRVAGGKRSWRPWKLADQLTLDPESITVITDKVKDGVLKWDAPKGDWDVIFIFSAPDGERPTLAAMADPGFAVNPLDRAASQENLEHFAGERTGLQSFYGAPFRAFFNDSFEFKCERHFTADFLAEFQKRRGYDLTPYLPVVLIPGADNFFFEILGQDRKAPFAISELDSRVRYDYSLTVSDLFIERYLDMTSQWAHERGLLARAQPYGLDIDIIRAAGHTDIPEVEQLYAGGSELFLKMVSSGACLYNRPIVSAESFVWAGRDYMTTPAKLKAAADKMFAAGVNQIIYHGMPYRKMDGGYGETGWFPWSSPYVGMGQFSSNISEADPYWKYIKDVNRYIARSQYLLRQGKPQYDLLIYYPFLGFPSGFSSLKGHEEFLFNGQFDGEPDVGGSGLSLPGLDEPLPDPRSLWLESVWPLIKELENNGYTWIWVNDESLAAAELKDGKIVIRGNEFKGVVVANAPWMRVEAAERLSKLRAVYWGDSEKLNVAPGMEQEKEEMLFDNDIQLSDLSRVREQLMSNGISPSLMYEFRGETPRLNLYTRVLEGEVERKVYFLKRWPEDYFPPLGFPGGCLNGHLVNTETGESQDFIMPRSVVRDVFAKNVFLVCDVQEELNQGDALFHAWTKEKTHISQADVLLPVGMWKKIDKWTLTVEGEDVVGGLYKKEMTELIDWRQIPELRTCSSGGIYKTELIVPNNSVKVMLRYQVEGASDLYINGVLVEGRPLVDYIKPGLNTIEIRVIPPLRNRFVGYGEKGLDQYRQFKGKGDTLLPVGLIGEVEVLVSYWPD